MAMRGMHAGRAWIASLFGMGLLGGGVLGARVLQTSEEPTSQGALACFELARRDVSLTEEQALRLCQGAASTTPAECYIASRPPATFLSAEQAIELCRCATSTGPVACYHRADHETTLETPQILQLCSPSLNQGLTQDCQPGLVPPQPWRFPYVR